jgi:hypothetical protein
VTSAQKRIELHRSVVASAEIAPSSRSQVVAGVGVRIECRQNPALGYRNRDIFRIVGSAFFLQF